jgi:hypothetical protein
LHFVLWAHGKQLVLDPGNFSYDHSRWRRYVLSTAGHNTVMVDGENQHRAGKKETLAWPRPWETPTPPTSDTRWISQREYDLAVGRYDDGYGAKNQIAVTHERQVLCVKRENLFVVADTLTPRDDAEHRYESLLHLDAAEATVDDAAKSVRTAGLLVVAAPSDGLALQIVKGKDDEPVQGWASNPWRAIPTAIYSKSVKGVARLLMVLEPLAPGKQPTVRSVKQPVGSLVEIAFHDGRTLRIRAQERPDGLAIERGVQ